VIINLVLLAAMAMLLLYSIRQWRKSPLVSSFVAINAVSGAVLINHPQMANYIANFVGVGRGADLVFYLFIVIALTAIFNLHLRLRDHAEIETELARAIALQSAIAPKDT